MATNSLRTDVLKCYKQLLRVREQTFKGDGFALEVTKQKVREEFRQNKNLNNPEEIKEALKVGKDSIEFLQTNVVQAKLTEKGNYKIKLEEKHIF